MVPEANQNQELEQLVERALKKDEAAFAQLYDQYFEKLYRFVYFRVNHKEVAQDLVSETFIRVWEKIPDISEAAAFNGWIYQIARNLVIDHYRSRKPTVDLGELENVLEYEDNIIDRVNLGFQQAEFLSALKKLNPDQRLVIKLKFIDDLGNREIAQILDKSEGAIRVIQHRAITELKQLIQPND